MSKIIHKSAYFQLGSWNRKTGKGKRGKGHRYYSIRWTSQNPMLDMTDVDVLDIVDPKREQPGLTRTTWTFKDRATAERRYMLLTMRWA
jgi:hypothetical protein